MSIKELNETSNVVPINGWQNQGIMYKFAKDNVPAKLRVTFLEISDNSFGRLKAYTQRKPHKFWAKIIGISEKTFYSHIHELIESGLIQVNHSDKYMKDGGSEAFSYSPIYPKGYGKIMLKSDEPASNQIEPQTNIWIPYEGI